EPEPSMDNPRKVLVSLNFNDEKSVSSLLYNVINIQKAYGQDNLEIAVLGWGPGVRALLNDSPVKARIESQMQYDIQFIACGNTLDTIGISPDNLIDGVELVKAGLPEIIERELMGWSIIWP
ncbi:MAG: DsrE family protein, partial [Rhodospirillaceae bacterium]|nr:DsrE family protein [Rhodospirillaceae bacterium]